MYKNLKYIFFVALLILVVSCKNQPKEPEKSGPDYSAVQTPEFVADSAFQFMANQVAFGPRVPQSAAQKKCLDYLVSQMNRWCDTVITQSFNATLWNGTSAKGYNVIASLNPDAQQRIMLSAHWDSRLWADHDPDEANKKSPIPGANDGASGIGVLMEMARVMSSMPPSVGIDFVFFDLEDQGTPEWAESYDEKSWCTGSQYWASNPHRPFYRAIYGVLLDMVGTPNPRFTKEYYSVQYAGGIMDKMWLAARDLGYSDIFQDLKTDPILDDHIYINRIAGIPTLDIVQNSIDCSFYPYWHTLKDDIDAISSASLKTVGTVVLKTIYADYPAAKQQ